jgi:hypothetical protein
MTQDRQAVAASALLMAVPGTSCRADRVDDIIAQEMVAQHVPGVALAVIRATPTASADT